MKKLKWVIEIEVSENWVEDGFNLTDDNVVNWIANALPYAYGFEIGGKVKKAPNPKLLAKLRGE